MKLPRWRPECPECGYSLRGLTGDRCPECGEPFPTTQRTFRRWAFRRISWDRRHRTSLLRAYFATVFLILFCPWKAARGLVIPDRWGRAVRWAIGHTLVAALVATLIGGRQLTVRWFVDRLWPSPIKPPHLIWWTDAPAERVITWFLEGLILWCLVLGALPLLAALISACIPGRHRAAKRGVVKWGLYATVVMPVVMSGWVTWGVITRWAARSDSWNPEVLRWIRIEIPIHVLVLAGIYTVWLGAGVSVNPYERKRSEATVVVWALGFVTSWLVFAGLLFPLGPLAVLL